MSLAAGLLLLSTEAEAGYDAAPGTRERQASGDCSGYTKMIGEMARGVAKLDGYGDSIQRTAKMSLPDGNHVMVAKTEGELYANLFNKSEEWPPLDGASWSVSSPGSPKCSKEIAQFKAASDAFLKRNGVDPQFELPSIPDGEFNAPAAGIVLEMVATLSTKEVCRGAHFSMPVSIQDSAGTWGNGASYMKGGMEFGVNGVTDACYQEAMRSTEHYSSAAMQWNSACLWGGRKLKSEGDMVWAAQCFGSVEEKRKKVPEPDSSLGIRQ